MSKRQLPPYRTSLAGTLLSAREAVMRPIRPILRDANLTDQQWRVLRVLIDQGEVEPSRLAEAALLHAPSVTRILRELSDRGLIARRTDAADGRRSIIAATHQGSDMVRRISEMTLKQFDLYAREFGVARLDALRGELTALTAVIAAMQSGD